MDRKAKYALVTGASSGIGWHITKELAARGYNIVAVSNQPDLLQKLKLAMEHAYSISVIVLEVNLARAESAKEVFDFCESQQLDVEILVNNAGMLIFGEAVDVPFEKVNTVLQLHMVTPTLLCRLFGKQMMTKKKGHILNVGSLSAVMPYPIISYYGPTKTFIRMFSRALRTELKPHNVQVTCLLPGATATELYDAQKIDINLGVKLGIMKKPESVAKAGVEALIKGDAECVPGLMNKTVMLLIPIIPTFMIGWIYALYLRKNK
jgi:short-subunit dehydrogenase